MFVQLTVIGFRNEQAIVIKKMDLLFVAHADIRMFAQKIMQCRSAGFLRTSDNEIEPLNFATVGAKHLGNVYRKIYTGSCLRALQLQCRRAQLSRPACSLSFVYAQVVWLGISLFSFVFYCRNDDFCAG